MSVQSSLHERRNPEGVKDRMALGLVKIMRFFADSFFRKRYGHRAVVLETVAAVPGMVGGMLQHFKALRHIRDDQGWIRELLDEAENERMHLMTFIEVAKPSLLERILIVMAQVFFSLAYVLMYLFLPRTAHRFVAYLEEEAVVSYTSYLAAIDAGELPNIQAPDIAVEYWNLPSHARLRDVVIKVREDEMHHRDVNHSFADKLGKREDPSRDLPEVKAIEAREAA